MICLFIQSEFSYKSREYNMKFLIFLYGGAPVFVSKQTSPLRFTPLLSRVQFDVSVMRLGSVIPNFFAESTVGPIQFYEWKGDSWCVLFSHPADFTPVCTSELSRFAYLKNDFQRRNVKLLALSCDSIEEHVRWIDDLRAFNPHVAHPFPYPIIADEFRELAARLDMIDESQRTNLSHALTVRALYVVGPENTLRLSMVYPVTTGRNIDEVLRVVDSLQLSDRLQIVATPVDWTPGSSIMVLPGIPDDEAEEMFPGDVESLTLPSGLAYIRYTSSYEIMMLH